MQGGEFVIVKSFPNEPVVRRICGETEDYVLICLEEHFKLWEEKGITPVAVNCPKARVFKYDSNLFTKLREAAYSLGDDNLLDALWNQAETYYSQNKGKQC